MTNAFVCFFLCLTEKSMLFDDFPNVRFLGKVVTLHSEIGDVHQPSSDLHYFLRAKKHLVLLEKDLKTNI